MFLVVAVAGVEDEFLEADREDFVVFRDELCKRSTKVRVIRVGVEGLAAPCRGYVLPHRLRRGFV